MFLCSLYPTSPVGLTLSPGPSLCSSIQCVRHFRSNRPIYSPNRKLNAAVTFQATTSHLFSILCPHIHPSGSDYKVLSTAPLFPPDAYSRATVPFTKDLLRQYDLDVACIPYNISPFSILDIARHLPHREAIVADDFYFNPSSLRPTLVCLSLSFQSIFLTDIYFFSFPPVRRLSSSHSCLPPAIRNKFHREERLPYPGRRSIWNRRMSLAPFLRVCLRIKI